MKNKNREKLLSFIEYCLEHPEFRFWQALRNWSGARFILMADDFEISPDRAEFQNIGDTFNIE